MILSRSDKKGAVLPLCAVTAIALVTAVGFAVNMGAYFYDRSYTENSGDAIALSLSTVEARGMNAVAFLNEGMFTAVGHIRTILVAWIASIGVALSGHIAPFLRLTRRAPGTIRKLWAEGVTLSKVARKIRKTYPGILHGYTISLMRYYSVKGVVTQQRRKVKNGKTHTLSLEVKDGKPLELLSIVREAKGSMRVKRPRNPFKRHLFKFLMRNFSGALKKALRLKGKIIPQVVKESSSSGETIIFLGSHGTKETYFRSLFPYSYKNVTRGTALVTGGSYRRATWTSRLIPFREKRSKVKNNEEAWYGE